MNVETISFGLLTNVLYDLAKITLNCTLEQFKTKSDKKDLNKPFEIAFKKTCEYFKDEMNTSFVINEDLLNDLINFDSVALELFFSKVDINFELIKENFDCSFISAGLKQFILINYPDENYEEDFFEQFVYVFKIKYKETFKNLCSKNNILYTKFMIDIVGLTLEDLDFIKNKINSIEKTTMETNDILKTEFPEIQRKLDIIANNSLFLETDTLLLPIKTFFENKQFSKCLDTIIHDYECKITNFTDEQKAKIYNYKGVCELGLNKLDEAEISFKKSIQFDCTDKVVANLCKCYLNSGKVSLIPEQLDRFKDKTSGLYLEIKFYDIFYCQENIEEAERYLDQNKNKIKTYNHLKGRILQKKMLPYKTVIEYFNKYLIEYPDDNIAKYELLTLRYSEIFDKNLIQFSFGTTQDFKLQIFPINNKNLNVEDLNKLIIDIQNFIKANIEKDYRISLILMLAILCSQRADLSVAEKSKNEILLNINVIKDDFNANNACMVCFLLNDFENAYCIYKKYLNSLEDTVNILILILFGLGYYDKCYNLLNNNNIDGLNTLKLLVEYKVEKRGSFINKIINNYEAFELKDKLLILDFCFEEKEYNFCKKEYINIVHKIIEGKENLQANVILMLAGKLDFFKEIILRNELVEYQWKKYPTPENFEIGLRCAIKLYNNQQFSDCLLILNKLNEFDPNNETVRELFINIDICNFSYAGIIEDYENGNLNSKYLYYVAVAYINIKKFDKAAIIIEQLDKQQYNYFHAKSMLCIFTNAYDDLFDLLINAYSLHSDDIEINKLIFDIVMFHCKNIKLPSEFKEIYGKALNFLIENHVIYSHQISEKVSSHELKGILKSIEPFEENINKNNSFKELFKQYESFILPIQLIYPFINYNKIEFWEELLNNKNTIKNLTNGSQIKNFHKNVEILDQTPNILVGFETLILLKELNIENEIKEVLKLKISNFTVKDIKNYLLEYENYKSEGYLLIDSNDNIQYNKKSDIPEKYITFLKSIIPNYEQMNFRSSNITNTALVKATEKISCPDMFNDALVASQDSNTIVWVDGTLGSVYNEFGVKTITTIEILQYLSDKNILSNKVLASLKVRLCKLNCVYIPISVNDLYYSILEDFASFILLLDTFNAQTFTKESLITVIKGLIIKLNVDNEISKLQIANIIKAIFDKFMFLYPNGDFIFELMLSIASSFIFLNNDLQINIGINLLNTLNSNFVISFYNNLILAIFKYIPETTQNKNILIQKLILNVPIEIRNYVKTYATENCNFIEIIRDTSSS